MVVIDSTLLLLMMRPEMAAASVKVDKAKERIEFLIQELHRSSTKIIIPTPALSEILVRAGAAASQQIVETLSKVAVFSIESFDTRAAIEMAAMSRAAIDNGNKRGTSSSAIWAKVKFDRQIVAIAKVCRATRIYSDDGDIRSIAKTTNIPVSGLGDLPLPAEDAQLKMNLSAPAHSMAGATGDQIGEEQGPTAPSEAR
jgi:hypothetical protein